MDTAELDRISYLTIQSAIEIHKTLGPGVLENVFSCTSGWLSASIAS